MCRAWILPRSGYSPPRSHRDSIQGMLIGLMRPRRGVEKGWTVDEPKRTVATPPGVSRRKSEFCRAVRHATDGPAHAATGENQGPGSSQVRATSGTKYFNFRKYRDVHGIAARSSGGLGLSLAPPLNHCAGNQYFGPLARWAMAYVSPRPPSVPCPFLIPGGFAPTCSYWPRTG